MIRTSTDVHDDDVGYLHADYARSFSEWATPWLMRHSRGWVLERALPDVEGVDAMGCYPLFCCRDWRALAADVEELKGRCVALSLVADPFGDHSVSLLQRSFEIVREYKSHYVVDPNGFRERRLLRKHRRNLDTAMRSVEVVRCADPSAYLDEWTAIYAGLCQRRGITGMRAFSRTAHALQLGVPGLEMFRASVGGDTVGLHLWYQQGSFAYGHLGAASPRGYELMASYALYWAAINHFDGKVQLVDIGAGPGLAAQSNDGLARFKRGWATDERMAYFCGRILDPARYADLARRHGASTLFPVYRTGV